MKTTCQCAVCGDRREDVATILGQYVCFDCLVGAAADAVDASEGPRGSMTEEQLNCLEERLGIDVSADLDDETTLADGARFDSAKLTQEWADGMRAAYPNLFRG